MNIVKAVSVIIGTIIGAGFASGKEIYIFFGQYGKFGIIGAIVSATLTGVIIYSTIAITKRLQIKSNNEFLAKISNSSKLKIILENVINAFLLVSFWIMCAGFCTFFKQEFKIPIIITASINAIITYFLLMKNMDGIIKLNLIVVFNKDLNKGLFCIRSKNPYKGKYNFVGGKVEENETNDEAAYRELFEETGISKNDIELDHFMDLNYFKYENNLQVYYGILKHDVNLVEEKNKLEWVELNQELLNNNKFGGNYNIPHIITQIKVFLKNGTGLGKY